MKDILIEIKNNLQGNNSRIDEGKKQINDLEHKAAKNNQNNKKKKESKKMRKVSAASETTSRGTTFIS